MSNKLNVFQKKDKAKKKDAIKQSSGPVLDVSSPTVVSSGEGLYKKLALHQTNIMQQVEIIANSLDKVFSEDKQPNYSDVITQLLQQLDCAISTTQKCLTKDVFEKNPGLHVKLETHKCEVHANVALLVKWADFSSRDSRYNMNRGYVFDCVTRFKDGLNCIVRLVAENVIPYNNKGRRSSVSDVCMHRTGHDTTMNGTSTLPIDAPLSTPGIPTRSHSVKPRLNVSKDSLNSDSSDSDVTVNRRSDSTERHEEYSAPSSHTTSENGIQLPPARKHSSPSQDRSFHLPNGDSEEKPPPIPIKKRKLLQQQHQFLQHQLSYTPQISPSHSFHQHSYSLPSTASAITPPISSKSPSHRLYDDVPPPLPTKSKSSRASSLAGILATPTLPHSQHHHHGDGPPLPLRVDSIAGLRSKLETHSIAGGSGGGTPPAKPPRTDNKADSATPPPPPATNLLSLIDQYNRTIQQPTGEAPPIPPKKRTVAMYNQLIHVQNYTFDDSLIPSLNIPDMVVPPPLPPKRRRRKPEQPVRNDNQQTVPITNGSPSHSIHKSNGDDLELSSDELDPADEKIDYLKIDEASPYLIFEQGDGGCTLKGGELEALIAYAASTSSSVKQYTEAFLSTYYTFITTDQLITKLLYRLDHFYNDGNQPVWQATTSLLVRVLTNLNVTLIKEAEIALIEVIHQMLKDGNLKFGQLVRNALVEKLNQKMPEFIPLSFAMCKKSSGRVVTITDFDPSEVAKQLTILDADYFYKVDVSEMLYWAKEHSEEKCPRLTLFTMHFNNVSQWTKSRLLDKDMDMKKREKLMSYFISVMKSLREIGNFNAYLAILSAIESAPVSRLDWSERVIKSLEEPRALIDSRGSFKNYRQAFSQTKPPCIPYIGLYLQDLTFLEEQPSKLEDGTSINFSKRWKQFKSVDHIRFSQTKQYGNYQPDPNIMGVFNNFENVETDEKLWERSTEIKPSNRQKTATHQS